jgi:hypothetical protein
VASRLPSGVGQGRGSPFGGLGLSREIERTNAMPETTTPTQLVADALRKVTATVQKELDNGHRSNMISAYELVDILLAISDELDPE